MSGLKSAPQMIEPWLRTNTRALGLAMLLPVTALVLGGLLAGGLLGAESSWVRGAGAAVALCAAAVLALLTWQLKQPRLAYADGHLLVYLRIGPPARVPIDCVEGFLLGQGPTRLPGEQHSPMQTSTVVIRLAERATEWASGKFHPALGSWCGGYITLRGTWCEPLHLGLVQSLNTKLAEAQRAARQPEPAL